MRRLGRTTLPLLGVAAMLGIVLAAGGRPGRADRPGGTVTAGGAVPDRLHLLRGKRGFHAPQESARILAEALDLARQGQVIATMLTPRAVVLTEAADDAVAGVTPDEEAPPDPYRRGGDPGRPARGGAPGAGGTAAP